MARLTEAKGKTILKSAGFNLPQSQTISTADQALNAANEIGPCVLKAQLLVTGRAAKGLIKFADTPEHAKIAAQELLGKTVDHQTCTEVLVEQKLSIANEYFAAVLVDDSAGKPVVVFSAKGGSGVEEIAQNYPQAIVRKHINVNSGLKPYQARQMLVSVGITGKHVPGLGDALVLLYKAFKACEARSLEINPLVITSDDKIYAADCHATVDDYAVFRHPELGIEMARELDHPATKLEQVAFNVEKSDYRGTFYFFQMAQGFNKTENYVGFHGAGGGGSMMNMDAIAKQGFKPANFCDTSGNPPASKVYRAVKIILAQPNIDGYFAGGSGVASQEQFQSARGMVKAFRELNLKVPAVIRLGGNSEEIAIEIIKKFCADLNAPVECYGKDTSSEWCAHRLRELIDNHKPSNNTVKPLGMLEPPLIPYTIETITGRITFDHGRMRPDTAQRIVNEFAKGMLKLNENGMPVLAVEPTEAKKRCPEGIELELIAFEMNDPSVSVDLPIVGYEDAVADIRARWTK